MVLAHPALRAKFDKMLVLEWYCTVSKLSPYCLSQGFIVFQGGKSWKIRKGCFSWGTLGGVRDSIKVGVARTINYPFEIIVWEKMVVENRRVLVTFLWNIFNLFLNVFLCIVFIVILACILKTFYVYDKMFTFKNFNKPRVLPWIFYIFLNLKLVF